MTNFIVGPHLGGTRSGRFADVTVLRTLVDWVTRIVYSTIGLVAGFAGALAACLSILYLDQNRLGEAASWGAVGANVVLAVTLVLLRVERRKRAATLAMLGEARQRLAYAVESASDRKSVV